MSSINYITDISQSSSSIIEKIKKIRHVVLDMDGTIYQGKTLFSYTIDFLNKLKRTGVSYSFLTNNPSRSTAGYLRKLKELGIEVSDEEIYTSAQATIDFLKHHRPEWKRLFILGTADMVEQFENNGFVVTSEEADDEPDALVVAFDRSLTYSRLCRAAWWAKQNKPYLATNPDWVCPTDEPVILVDCGSICACIEAATGKKPDKVLGKPQPEMLDGIFESKNLHPEQVAMVGDRIYTDMKMAHRSHSLGVLVLSGEATLEDAEKAEPEVDLILPSIEELGKLIEYVHVSETNLLQN